MTRAVLPVRFFGMRALLRRRRFVAEYVEERADREWFSQLRRVAR